MNRRQLLQFAGLSAVSALAEAQSPTPLFDGKTLDGWLQIENNATSLSASSIKNPATFAAWLTNGNDAMSAWLRSRLPDSLKTDLAADPKAALPALVKELNQILAGPSLYQKDRFTGIVLRRETASLIVQQPTGQPLARLNKLLLEDAYPDELTPAATTGWVVKDGAMASTGAGRGVIYTAKDYARFRLAFTMRHVSGDPDHQACVLIFCTRPEPGAKPLDALGGIQFQPPNGGHWDYRPGKNNIGAAVFTTLAKPHFDPHAWSRVELTADASTGEATMKVAQPPAAPLVQVLAFKDPAAGKPGPIAWQMHNAGLFDEYKDVSIEA